MTNEILQPDQYNTNVMETTKIDPEIIPVYISANEPAADWDWSQPNIEAFFANAKSSIKELYESNRSVLVTLGLVYVAFLGTRLLFAALNAIDDIPLVSPILKLVGLIYTASFAWNHLVKEHDRQELVETFNRTKAEILGSHSPEKY
jgi:CAAD domains of cyanobacterial aminoacyl-tRNA synthetase